MRISVRYWRCAQIQYRKIMAKMVYYRQTPDHYMPKSEADIYFADVPNGDAMLEAFRENCGIEEYTIEPEHGSAFIAWECDYDWVVDLQYAIEGDCLHLDDDLCQQMVFPASRDPDCTYEDW